jgi:hypothetical protein
MKILKSFIACLFLTSTMAIQAHGIKLSAEEKALVITFRMDKYLQLTEPQKTSVMKINQNAFEKMALAHQQFKEDKKMLQKSRKEIFDTRNSDLEKTLTKEQFETFKQKQKEEMEQRKKEQERRKADGSNKTHVPAPVDKSGDKTPAPSPAPGK